MAATDVMEVMEVMEIMEVIEVLVGERMRKENVKARLLVACPVLIQSPYFKVTMPSF